MSHHRSKRYGWVIVIRILPQRKVFFDAKESQTQIYSVKITVYSMLFYILHGIIKLAHILITFFLQCFNNRQSLQPSPQLLSRISQVLKLSKIQEVNDIIHDLIIIFIPLVSCEKCLTYTCNSSNISVSLLQFNQNRL